MGALRSGSWILLELELLFLLGGSVVLALRGIVVIGVLVRLTSLACIRLLVFVLVRLKSSVLLVLSWQLAVSLCVYFAKLLQQTGILELWQGDFVIKS